MSILLVLKFGGTSLGTSVRVRRAARRVAAHLRRGHRVVVVVSAAGHTTDRILSKLQRLAGAGHPPLTAPGGWAREVDRALATGEDRSAALLAAALWQIGVPARSLRGGEAGIRGDGPYGAGHIDVVTPDTLRRLAAHGIVPVVSGFQCARDDGETVTLGRGGSDTSAVAVAAALGATCHIITDVAAVHDRDPRVDPSAQPIGHLTHEELLQLTESGAQVVHPAAARIARDAGVPLRVYHFSAPLDRAGSTIGSPRVVDLASAGGAA